ncbi:hypothetical protein C2S52_004135 [Perilla frutescens var. hirtella]|nr:hypothetical protein C2S52_004135 [Perilla frutescens var. hirtella]
MKRWNTKVAERYMDMVYSFKKNKTKGYSTFMPPQMWEGFKQHWDSEAFKAKSTKGVELNHVAWEIFKRLHDTADGSYSDGKSTRIAELSQPIPGTDEVPKVDMSTIYVDTSRQHSKKNRIFGFDSQSRSISAASVSSAAPPQPDTQAAIRELQTKMNAQAELLQAQQE